MAHDPRVSSTWAVPRGRSGGWRARLGADLIHANSIRAGLSAVYGTRTDGPPAVVHVRDCLPPGRSGFLDAEGDRQAGCRCAFQLPLHGSELHACRRPVHGRESSTARSTSRRFDPSRIEPSAARARLGLDPSTFVLAVIAQISPWKGQDDAIRILGHLESSEPTGALVLVGSPKFVSGATRYDNRAYADELERLTDSLGLRERVMFLGERDDIPQVLRRGRRTAGAILGGAVRPVDHRGYGDEVPVVATSVGGPSEIVRPGRGWAAAAAEDPRALGRRGRGADPPAGAANGDGAQWTRAGDSTVRRRVPRTGGARRIRRGAARYALGDQPVDFGTKALLERLGRETLGVLLDCWRGEPVEIRLSECFGERVDRPRARPVLRSRRV